MSPFREPARPFLDPSSQRADLLRYEADLRRSTRRRKRVAAVLRGIGYALAAAAVVAFFAWWIVAGVRAEERCEARGGVYLWREFTCVPGFPK